MLKANIRKIYLARQKALSAREREDASIAICQNFFSGFDLNRVDTIHIFLPIEKNNEIDTFHIIKKLEEDFPGIKIVVPVVNFEREEMQCNEYKGLKNLRPNKWGILEPIGLEKADPAAIDMVITPLLAFDRNFQRVGYGKGFYDWFFKSCRPDCLKIGVSYLEPIEKISDVNEGDVPLDYCITPEKTYKAG